MLHVLEQFDAELMRIGLYEAVRAICHGIEISVPNFFAIFKLYYPASETFFTPVGELRLALHEMWEISNIQYPDGFDAIRGVLSLHNGAGADGEG